MSSVKNGLVEDNKRELEIFIDAKTFQDACKKVYLKRVKRINVPGFRKGKAPKKVIEKFYGSDVFFDSAIELTYPKAVDDAIREKGLDVVGLEKLEPLELSEKNGCKLKVVCVLKPDAEIENYKGIEVKVIEHKVNDKVVQDQINFLKERCGKLVSVEGRTAAVNDVVLIDFEGFVDGKNFAGGKSKNYSLKLGSGQFVSGFEDQIVGHKIGDEFEVNVVFPGSYHEVSLRGKSAKFNCKLNEIKVLQLPKEDDEFAKDVSKFDTLQELKDDIKSNLTEQFKKQFDAQVDSEIMNFLAKNVVVQIPEVMLINRTDELAKNFENNLAGRGINLDQYLSVTKVSGYDLKDSIKSQAEFQLKTDLALEKIAKLEKLEPVSDDYNKERERIAELYKSDVEKIKNLFPDEVLNSKLRISKALDFVRSNAKILKTSFEDKVSEVSVKDSEKKDSNSKVSSIKKSPAKSSRRAKVGSAKLGSDSKNVKPKKSSSSVKSRSTVSKSRPLNEKTKK